jgi:hypothetical protein
VNTKEYYRKQCCQSTVRWARELLVRDKEWNPQTWNTGANPFSWKGRLPASRMRQLPTDGSREQKLHTSRRDELLRKELDSNTTRSLHEGQYPLLRKELDANTSRHANRCEHQAVSVMEELTTGPLTLLRTRIIKDEFKIRHRGFLPSWLDWWTARNGEDDVGGSPSPRRMRRGVPSSIVASDSSGYIKAHNYTVIPRLTDGWKCY